MEPTVCQDRKSGFTLIEVLVAMVILAVMLLGLYYSLIVSYRYSLSNILRDEAVKLAQEEMERIRTMPFDNVTEAQLNPPGLTSCNASNPSASVERQVRNSKFRFGEYFNVTDIDSNLKQVKLTVCWDYRKKHHEYVIESIIRKEE